MSQVSLVMSHVSLLLLLWPVLPALATLVPGLEVKFKSKAGYKFSGTDDDKVCHSVTICDIISKCTEFVINPYCNNSTIN